MDGNRPRQIRLSPKKHLAFGLITAALSSLIVLAGAEIYVRRTQPFYTPETLRKKSFQFEPSVLARYNFIPDQQFEDPRIRINAQGYRGEDYAIEKAPGETRILFLGGSMVFTIGAPDGEDWPSLTGKELEERGIDVEVMNGAVTGSTSADSLGRFYGELWRYHPDYVVICLAWNDLKLLRYFRQGRTLLRSTRPYQAGQDPRQIYNNALDRTLSRTSQVYVRLRTRYYDWKIPSGTEGAIEESNLHDTFDPDLLSQFGMNLRLLVDAVRRAGGTPVLVTQPTLVVEDTPEAIRQRIKYGYIGLTHDALIEALAECREIAVRIGEEENLPVIDAYAEMSGRPAFFHDHVHVSPAGSEAIARIVAEGLAPFLRGDPATGDAALPGGNPGSPGVSKTR